MYAQNPWIVFLDGSFKYFGFLPYFFPMIAAAASDVMKMRDMCLRIGLL